MKGRGTARWSRPLALAAVGLALGSCGGVAVTRLYALRLAGAPSEDAWRSTLPLRVKAGGGNVSGPDRRLAELELDTDAVHSGSASCHHGPPITAPVSVQGRAFYTDGELHVELRWRDATADAEPRAWRRGPEGWRLDEGDEDGVAILWTRAEGGFGCQEACHMSDFALRQGALIDLRAMYLVREGDWEEAWVWKASRGAEALVLGRRGFETIMGEPYRTVNSAAASDPRLQPEARRAATFGPDDRPLVDAAGARPAAGAGEAPAYRYAGAAGGGGLVATAERDGGAWRVVFTRALEAGPRRQRFEPGGRYRFGLAVFDATSTNHHIVRDTQVLELVVPPPPPPGAGEGGGIL